MSAFSLPHPALPFEPADGPVEPADGAAIVARLRSAGCVFAEDEASLLIEAAASAADLDALVAARVSGLPLEPLLGWAQFGDLRITIEPGVFVPRRRTEFLARLAVEAAGSATSRSGRACVLDMCCGTGALGAALAAHLQARIFAVDIDEAAVRCARQNLTDHGGQVFQGDLFDPLPPDLRGQFDVIMANAPYVPTEAIALMPPEARDHEPMVALDGGPDGLDVQRRVIAGARDWLTDRGFLLIETSVEQSPKTLAAFENAGFSASITHSEEYGATAVIGSLFAVQMNSGTAEQQ